VSGRPRLRERPWGERQGKNDSGSLPEHGSFGAHGEDDVAGGTHWPIQFNFTDSGEQVPSCGGWQVEGKSAGTHTLTRMELLRIDDHARRTLEYLVRHANPRQEDLADPCNSNFICNLLYRHMGCLTGGGAA
jgi:hypothetical protein